MCDVSTIADNEKSNDCETVSTCLSSLTGSSSFQECDSVQNIRVVARVRPLSQKETNGSCKELIKADEESRTIVVDTTKKFEYDAVFGPEATQSYVYEKTDLQGMIRNNLFRGFNVTLLAYGQTGSGKTHTVFGNSQISHDGGLNDIDGIIPRTIYDMFSFINNEMDNGTERVKVEMSYLEIYNEEAKDLLDPNAGELSIRENKVEGVVVQNLSRHGVASRKEIFDLLKSASGRRATAATAMNEGSSRSHAICTFYITVIDSVCDEKTTAKMTLVDLAGSERIKKTGAEGTRLKEGININKGLFVLGQVVSALSEIGQQTGSSDSTSIHVKYRDSKLTRLLQDSLGGNSKTVMVACISPSDSNAEESINTLRYAERTRNIRTSATRNIVVTSMSPLEAAALRKENQMLKLQLFEAQTKLNSKRSTPVEIVVKNSHTLSLPSSEPAENTVENDINGLDLKKLETITKLKVHCSYLKENIEQLEQKAQSSVENSLKAALRADKWQLKCEELMTVMKRHSIPYPESIKNIGRFQSLNLVNDLRKELVERQNELHNAKIDAELSRVTAAALLNANGDESKLENEKFIDEINSTHSTGNLLLNDNGETNTLEKFNGKSIENFAQTECDERLTAELVAMGETIDQKEDMFRRVSQERQCMDEIKHHFEAAMNNLKDEVETLTAEREQILIKVQKDKPSANNQIATVKMRQRIAQLEDRIKELRLTQTEHTRTLRQRENAERKCEKLIAEIKADKKKRNALQRKLREESQTRRSENKAAKVQASRMLRDSQKLKIELTKVKDIAARQEAVLKRKISDAMNKHKALSKDRRKRSHPTVNINLPQERKDFLHSWLDSEIVSALSLKELKCQIDGHQEILDNIETRKQELICQKLADEDTSPLIKNLEMEIEMRSGIIQQLEKNTEELFKVANRNPKCSRVVWQLENEFWRKLSHSEVRYMLNLFFIRLIDEKYEYSTLKVNHESILSTAVRRALQKQKHVNEEKNLNLKIQHSSAITDLLDVTKVAVQTDIEQKLKNKSNGLETGVNQILNDFTSSYKKITDSVKSELGIIKLNQESMKTVVDDVVVGLISHNEANAVIMSKKEKKKKKKKNVNEDEHIEISEFEDDADEEMMDDSDDSDWCPTPARHFKAKNLEIDGNRSPHIEKCEEEPSLEVENYENMKVLELRRLLRERNLAVGGRKVELIARLKCNVKPLIVANTTINIDDTVAKVETQERIERKRVRKRHITVENASVKKCSSSECVDDVPPTKSVTPKFSVSTAKRRVGKDDVITQSKKKKCSRAEILNSSFTSKSSTSNRKKRTLGKDSVISQSKKKMRTSADSLDNISLTNSAPPKFITTVSKLSKSNGKHKKISTRTKAARSLKKCTRSSDKSKEVLRDSTNIIKKKTTCSIGESLSSEDTTAKKLQSSSRHFSPNSYDKLEKAAPLRCSSRLKKKTPKTASKSAKKIVSKTKEIFSNSTRKQKATSNSTIVTNIYNSSAQKKAKDDRRRSMFQSVNRAMVQLEALEEAAL